jgi:hypothetical protein
LHVDPKSATWTTQPNHKTGGQPDPNALTTGNGSGFLVSDGITATYSRVLGETASPPTYHITAALGPTVKLGNYNITNNRAEFTIYNGPTITVTDANGDQVPSGATKAMSNSGRRYRFLSVWHKRPTKIDGAGVGVGCGERQTVVEAVVSNACLVLAATSTCCAEGRFRNIGVRRSCGEPSRVSAIRWGQRILQVD